jgi:hypothetical protein
VERRVDKLAQRCYNRVSKGEYADGKTERHSDTAIKVMKKIRENALQRSKKKV